MQTNSNKQNGNKYWKIKIWLKSGGGMMGKSRGVHHFFMMGKSQRVHHFMMGKLEVCCLFGDFYCLITLCHCPWWPRVEGTKEESTEYQWIHLQWQMNTPSQFNSGEVTIGQVNVSACLFPSAIIPGRLVWMVMGLLLEKILQQKQNLKQYFRLMN